MLLTTLFFLVAGAFALKFQCSKDFDPVKLMAVFEAMRDCGTPTSLMRESCYDRLIQRSRRSYSDIGYHMASWERETSSSFESLRYIQHLSVAKADNWWGSIVNVLQDNHNICWYVRDCMADQRSDSFSGHLGSVFFVDGPFREPLVHAATDTRKVLVRQGNQCFTPDEFFKPSRIKAIRMLIREYNNERVVTSLRAKTYRAVIGKVSTDLVLSATFARLIRNYRCSDNIRCNSEFTTGRPYLPQSPKDFLRKVLRIIEEDGMLCFQERPISYHVQHWYYLTGFDYKY
ncbi:hypothetical protein CP532_5620 [Ophiocordyceps camponoti-leonardi (nom. inval.)]|nr:hypothetical protein CP532_5620 [Ophiocordyceps camponoti-leonardi (nom. inval.)]